MTAITKFDILWTKLELSYYENNILDPNIIDELIKNNSQNIDERTLYKAFSAFCFLCTKIQNNNSQKNIEACEQLFDILGMGRFCSGFYVLKPSVELFFNYSDYGKFDQSEKISLIKNMCGSISTLSKEDKAPTMFCALSLLVNWGLSTFDVNFTHEIINFVESLSKEESKNLGIISAIPFNF